MYLMMYFQSSWSQNGWPVAEGAAERVQGPLARACARALEGEDQWLMKTTGLDRVPVEPFTVARVRVRCWVDEYGYVRTR